MISLKFSKGMIPVVVQDTKSRDVLMVAYANKQAIEDLINTNLTKGWTYVGVLPFENSTYLVFEKVVVD
jgi:phosphoribosyl-AMP cyclohydrolase